MSEMANLTPRAQQVLALARMEADRLNHAFIDTEHLLLGILRLRQGVAFVALGRLRFVLREELGKRVVANPPCPPVSNIPYSPSVTKVLAFGEMERSALNHPYFGTEHILLGLVGVAEGVAGRLLHDLGVTLDETRSLILRELDPNLDPAETRTEPDDLRGSGGPVTPWIGSTSSPVLPEPSAGKGGQPKGFFKRIIHSIDAFVFDLAASQAGAETLMSFTPRAQQVLGLAREEAVRLGHNFVGTEHLLLGLIRLRQGVAVNVLKRMGLDIDSVRSGVERQVGTGPDQNQIGNIPYPPRVKKVLALAGKEAKALNHTYVGTEHILLGLRREGEGVAGRVLKSFGVDLSQTRHEILKELDPFQAAREQVWPLTGKQASSIQPWPLARQQSASMDKPTAPPIIHTMKLGIINSAFQQVGMKTVTGLEHVKRIGFDTVDIFTEAMGISPEEVSLVARTCERLDLPIVSLPVVSVGLIDFNEPVREFHVGRTKQFIDLAKTWGAKNVLLVLGEYIWQREVIPAEAQWQCGIETCRRLGEYADKQGIDIALELEPFRLSLLNNVDSMVRFIDECNHPRVRANIDISHLVLADTSPADVLKLENRAIHVHISDCDGKVHGDLPPGRGVVKFEPYLQAIKELKIDGVVSIELEYSPDPERIVEWVEEAYRETAKRMEQAGLRG